MSSSSAADPRADLTTLLELIERLRAPDGCPWDRKQTLPDVRAYLLEEAHETAAAIDSGDWREVGRELGDLLFQVSFIGCLAKEARAFTLEEVITSVHAKMVERHPHVFGGEKLDDADAVARAWERRKVEKKAAAAQPGDPAAGAEAGESLLAPEESLLAGLPPSLPALTGAYRMTQKAAGVGFDWPSAEPVLEKLDEELAELRAALAGPDGTTPPGSEAGSATQSAIQEELGDLLFTVVNLARKLGVDPEAALARTNLKFRRRFAHVEAGLGRQGRSLIGASLEEMDALWEEAKASEA